MFVRNFGTRHIILSVISRSKGVYKVLNELFNFRIKSTVATVIYFYISHKKMESKRQVKFIPIFMRSQAANLRQLYQNGRLLTTTSHSDDIRTCWQRNMGSKYVQRTLIIKAFLNSTMYLYTKYRAIYYLYIYFL